MLALADKLDAGPEVPRGQGRPQGDARRSSRRSRCARRPRTIEKKAKETKDFGQVRRSAVRRTSTSTTATRKRRTTTRCSTTPASASRRAARSASRSRCSTCSRSTTRTSKHREGAIARLGKAFGDIAFYDRAAEKLEEYAKKYAGEKDAYDAMSDAVFYRKGIGDDAKAIDDTKYFVKTFGTKKPAEAANAAFSLTSIYEKQGDNDAVIKHLRDYIRTYGAKGGADKLVIAHAKIGQILWDSRAR